MGNCYSYFRFENELIIATGKGEPAWVMSEYGFKNVLSLDEHASYFENIDPVSQYKRWTTRQISNRNSHSLPVYNISSEGVKGAFVVSDPVDWGRVIQPVNSSMHSMQKFLGITPSRLLAFVDLIQGLPGQPNGQQPPLYFAADDLEYQDIIQAAFPTERLGMGAFRIALESVFNSQYFIHHCPLEYVSYGKPNPFVFRNPEAILSQFLPSYVDDNGDAGSHSFRTLYMIGDNPMVDVKGRTSLVFYLDETGVFKGVDNHAEFPADLVVDTVEEAVEYILPRELIS
ncbi:Hydrolase family protein / HAD-superfamily protein [Citrus sinensis]|uniref:Uncharacterized protein n=1 Tax=Citrus clementina TaxID=85681 RepID=V4T862_CITCL|nr:hypothetical protein CICLE_v10032311mg [Citrus x clementina]KAH9703418.1 Hydrolase family protein / HAD-superfamily protein [Citrus sinensis]